MIFVKIINFIKNYINTYILQTDNMKEENEKIVASFNGIPFDENKKTVTVGITIFNNSWVDSNCLTSLYKWLFEAYNINVNIDVVTPDVLYSINNNTYDILIIIMGDKNKVFPKSKAEQRLTNIKEMLSKILVIQETEVIKDVIPYANIMIRCAREYDTNSEEIVSKFSLKDVSESEKMRLLAVKENNFFAEKIYKYIVSQMDENIKIGFQYCLFKLRADAKYKDYHFVHNGKVITAFNLLMFKNAYEKLINEGFYVYYVHENFSHDTVMPLFIVLNKLNEGTTYNKRELIEIKNYEMLSELYCKKFY